MKKRRNPQLERARREHDKFLRSVGALNPRPGRAKAPSYKVDTSGLPPCSDHIATKIIYSPALLRVNSQETQETLSEIAAKAKRVAPHFNKGAAQYVTPGLDPKFIGRK